MLLAGRAKVRMGILKNQHEGWRLEPYSKLIYKHIKIKKITVGKSWIQTEVRTEAPLLNSCLQMCWGTLIYWSIFLVNYGKFLNSSFLQLVDVFSSWGSFGLEYKLYSNPKGFNSGGLGLSLVWSMFNALMKKKVNRQIFLKIWCKLDTKCPENRQ